MTTVTATVTDPVTRLAASRTTTCTITRTMYDAAAASAAAIPQAAQIVAAGPAWTPADLALFPAAVIVRIATTITDISADVLDVEQKFVWPPAAAIPWIQARQEQGFHGTLYLWEGNLAAMQAALATVTLARPVLYWLADQTGTPHSLPGAVATQWCNYANGPIPDVDISEVTDPGWLTTYR